MRRLTACLFLAVVPGWAAADTTAIDAYLAKAEQKDFFGQQKSSARKSANQAQVLNAYSALLPATQTTAFAIYANAASFAANMPGFLSDVTGPLFNKLLGSSGSTAGTTSLVSNSAIPAALSLATEIGAITQSNSGNVTTLRTNLFAISRPLLGAEVFPICTDASTTTGCSNASRWLRRISASYSAQTSGSGNASAQGTSAQTDKPVQANLLSGGYRMAGWSARIDWNGTNAYADAGRKNSAEYKKVMQSLAKSAELSGYEHAVSNLFSGSTEAAVYNAWQRATIPMLEATKSEAEGKAALAAALDDLLQKLSAADPQFFTKINIVQSRTQSYYDARDAAVEALQNNKFSTEFTSLHTLNQPNTSNIRVIYALQPAKVPLLFTFNGAVSWYDTLPADVKPGKVGRLRDVQVSAQMDRKVATVGAIKDSVLSFAGYYQWMLTDALITFDQGNTVAGITLPGQTATLLAPKGNIAVAQLKWTLPIKNGIVKVPVSFTWANRTELINEAEKRGQIGLTLDLDSAFAK